MYRLLYATIQLLMACLASGFTVPSSARVPIRSLTALSAKSTLTDETTWRFRIVLNGVQTEKGKKVNELFVVEAQFLEDINYEPPQGSVVQILPDKTEDGENSRTLKIKDGRWKLSEDPNERKDGLWVWGLFKEPLYPFMLLQMETEKVPIPGEEQDFVKPLKLFAQINHSRDDKLGAVLEGATLNVREVESMKADPFGGATVDIYEEKEVGKISIQPVE